MPRRDHRSSSRRLPLVVVGILLIAAVGVGVFVLLRPPSGSPGAATEAAPLPFTFQLARTRVSAVDEKPAAERQEAVVSEVHGLLDQLYTVAFVDPRQWQGGRFPGLAAFFHGPAAERAVEDLDDLTLGGAATEITRVEPGRTRLRVSLLFDEDEAPVSAFADTRFRAAGETMDGRVIRIEHEARYLLRHLEDGWRIVGYDVTGELAAHRSAAGGEA